MCTRDPDHYLDYTTRWHSDGNIMWPSNPMAERGTKGEVAPPSGMTRKDKIIIAVLMACAALWTLYSIMYFTQGPN